MRPLTLSQLGELQDLPYTIKENSVVFHKNSNASKNLTYRVIFESYIVTPFEGFDFHEKYNSGIAPPSLVMTGKIESCTDKMYMLDVISEMGERWKGWCPKKSCRLEVIG